MYVRKVFEKTPETWHTMIEDYGFGTLLVPSLNPSQPNDVKTVRAPFLLRSPTSIYCHVAFENPIWKDIQNSQIGDAGAPVVAMFAGPHHYISPIWYKSEADKPGGRVPTWDHASVTLKGRAKIVSGVPEKIEFLTLLTRKFETERVSAEPGSPEWELSYLTNEKLHKMTENITVIAITIDNIEGNFKMGQNGSTADCESSAQALTKLGTDDAIETAYLIRSNAHHNPFLGLRKIKSELQQKKSKQVTATRLGVWEVVLGSALVVAPLFLYRLITLKKFF